MNVSDIVFLSMDIELTNLCRNRCAMCPRHRMARPKGFMSMETLMRIADELAGLNTLVTFSGMGDPLLHPRCADFMRILRSRHVDAGIVVHPSSLARADAVETLIGARPNRITVSFPSVRRDVFERLCPGVTFEQGLEQVRRLRESSTGICGVGVSGLVTELNADEKEEYFSFWKREGVGAWLRPCHGRGGNLDDPEVYKRRSCGLSSGSCGMFRYHSFMTWQGDILACCHDITGETLLGNVNSDGIEGIEAAKRRAAESMPPFSLCNVCDEPLREVFIPPGPVPTDRKGRMRLFRNMARIYFSPSFRSTASRP